MRVFSINGAVCVMVIGLMAAPFSVRAAMPDVIQDTLIKAYQTQNDYIVGVVKQALKDEHPNLVEQIDAFSAPQPKEEQKKIAEVTTKPAPETKPVETLEPAAGKEEKNWKGNLEGGLSFVTGNTDKQDINVATTVEHTWAQWENTAKVSAMSGEEDNVRNEEEYRLKNQTRYRFEEHRYVFGEVEYVNDRFGGFDYRLSELIGYGQDLYDENDVKITGEASVGARQSEFSNGEDENTLLVKVGGKADWKINDNLTFSEELSSSFGQEAVITESLTALKSQMTDTLYLKVGVDIEHIDDAPEGRKHTDTQTTVSVGYDF